MALPNVTINLENGNLGRIAQSDDGGAGLILTGAAVSDKLALSEVYLINSRGTSPGWASRLKTTPLHTRS